MTHAQPFTHLMVCRHSPEFQPPRALQESVETEVMDYAL